MCEKTLIYVYDDTGYTAACPSCGARHGSKVFGSRDILIKKCTACELKKGGLRDEDFERLKKNSWKIDPPPPRNKCRARAMASRNPSPAREPSKRKAYPVVGFDRI